MCKLTAATAATQYNQSYCASEPTRARTTLTTGGTDVNATKTVPNRLIERLDSAAALGSELSSNAVAMADELPPKVTPRVT